ncbi:hypothetical protein Pstr01_30160 [Pseudomonas straminea]|uniref:Uncharacterized protein n=1 Tax=Pseudomonas straminea TaxID=47882 RepID=A0A1I1WF43_PSEOC|nr:hypothetical protein [Pseudomonas straminea]GLX14777.1 hypothetical protein Pstr01_30160 [Pseudomonas straminea]SFD93008.1 hypothetical protein SAMN05216372_105413 [Pseudomonas straminea]
MQAHQPQGGGAEPTTPPARTRPPLAGSRLDMSSICDICGKARSTRKHAKCSRIRQKMKDAYWQTHMAEQAAKKQAKQERRRYAR